MSHPQPNRMNLLLRKIHPAISDNRVSMLPDELEMHLKKLSAKYMLDHAIELNAQHQHDIILAQLVEFAVEALHKTEKFNKRVYEWLEDDSHWIWIIAKRVADEIYVDTAIRRLETLVSSVIEEPTAESNDEE